MDIILVLILLGVLNDGTVSGDFDVAKKTLANPEEVDFNLIAVPGVTSRPQVILLVSILIWSKLGPMHSCW